MSVAENEILVKITSAGTISIPKQFRKFMAHQGKYFKIRYRGSRNTPADIGRGYNNRATTCLKENARSFSVYNY